MIFESLADKEGGRSNINTPKGASFAGVPFCISRAGQNGGRSPVSGIFREMRSDPLKQSLQDGALDVVVVLDAVLLGVAGQHQGQSAVAGDVAGGAEAVLQGEDGEHQSGAGAIEHQNAGDEAQRSHDGAAGDAGSADGEDAEQGAEEEHGADAGQMAVEDLGDGHAEEDLSQDRAAEVDVGEQGDAEADQ